jgi:hypothetical protein
LNSKDTEQSLLVCWKMELNNSSSFTKFPIFASAFDLLLQSNNGSLELWILCFFLICKQASEGQVRALFRVKRLQPCGNYRMLHPDHTRPGHVCDYASYEFCDAVQHLYETFFETNIAEIELGELHQIYCYFYNHCTIC